MLAIDLKHKRAVVTGGSRGVGRAVALMLADAGADVGISFRSREAEAADVVSAIGSRDVRAWAMSGDLADSDTSRRLIDMAVTEFGGLDIFIGNAGIWPPEDVPVAAMTDTQWRRTISINLDAIFYSVRAAAGAMSDGGRIVLVGSTAGQRGEAFHADYAATKGAMIAMVKGIAIELAARDITVNCVAPGWIDTEMCEIPYSEGGRSRIASAIPLGRIASAQDIAGPIVFLCSNLGRHITGEILNVNGGSVLCG